MRLKQNNQQLIFDGGSPARVSRFFSLDVNLAALAREIDQDPIIHEALEAHWGLRLIRQEPWECLASFILSAYNNIVRLTGMLDTLAERYGETGRFPTPERLARVSEKELRGCGLGYRAPYLKAAAQMAASGKADLQKWKTLEDDALREALLEIPGIGEKVVECVMLFGYGRDSAFPVDVWINRAMRRWYFRNRQVPDKKIRVFARKHFGPRCGWAQQYLYHFARWSARSDRATISSNR